MFDLNIIIIFHHANQAKLYKILFKARQGTVLREEGQYCDYNQCLWKCAYMWD